MTGPVVAQKPGLGAFAVAVSAVGERDAVDWPMVFVPEKLPPLPCGMHSTTSLTQHGAINYLTVVRSRVCFQRSGGFRSAFESCRQSKEKLYWMNSPPSSPGLRQSLRVARLPMTVRPENRRTWQLQP